MLDSVRHFLQLWKSSKNYKYDLDSILAQANPEAPLHTRLVWLVDLMHWVRYIGAYREYQEIKNVRVPSARLKFLLMVCERNPEWKKKSAQTIRSILRDVKAVDLFSEAGLPEEQSFWGEFVNRVYNKVMPERPLGEGLSSLFSALFPGSSDVEWMASMDPQLILKIMDFISFEEESSETWALRLSEDIEESLYVLASQVRSMGLSPAMRKRMTDPKIQNLPFFNFTKELENLFVVYRGQQTEAFPEQVKNFRKLVWKCMDAFNDVYRHLDAYGVNNTVVYILESGQAKLKRIDDLVTLLSFEKIDSEMLIYFISQLIEENQERRSLMSLLEQNLRLISRKIVDRSAETGHHYISQNTKEYRKLFLKACGGGALTAFTVVVKMMMAALGMPLFIEGFLYSINYAVSFLLIQLFGFTLATKQPAMTGPTMAAKLQHMDTGDSVEALVDEIVKLIRSQFIGIIGNVITVMPLAILVSFVYSWMSGHHIVHTPEKADYVFAQTDALGATFIYASFTGVLLWLSSIFAGYMDNWFFLNRMKEVITYNLRLNFIFGADNCKKAALYLEKNISSFAANVSLGFLMGLTPQVMSFLGLFFLDIRHVTLSSGMLALGFIHYGVESFSMFSFWRALAGIGMIGTLNVAVSFSLAFFVAIRSRNIKALQRRAIYSAIISRFKTQPMSFFYPLNARDKSSEDTEGRNGENSTSQQVDK